MEEKVDLSKQKEWEGNFILGSLGGPSGISFTPT